MTFEGDFYTVKRFRLGVRLGERRPKIFVAALNEQMLRLGGRARRRRAAQLPPRVARAVVRRARARRRRRRGLRVRALRRDRPRPLRRPRPQGPARTTRSSTRTRTSSRAAGFADEVDALPEPLGRTRPRRRARRDRRRVGRRRSRSWATPSTCAPRCRRTPTPARLPIVFALPWGEDRRATVQRERSQRPRVAPRRGQRPENFALPGPCSRNDCTPVARVVGAEHLDERVGLEVETLGERPSEPVVDRPAWRGPSRRPRPRRARAAQCSAFVLHLVGAARPGRGGRARALRRRAPAGRSRRAPWRAPGRSSRARRCVPPAPGMMPSRISGWPRRAVSRADAQVARERELAARRRARSRGSRRSPAAGSPRPRRTRRGTRRPTRARRA